MKKCIAYLGICFLGLMFTPLFLHAQGPEFPPPSTRTVVADVLDVEGDFIIVRGERGEIRIEVKPDTTITEEFQYGDRVKAVLRPNDSAISVVRAGKDEPTGVAASTPASPPTLKKAEPTSTVQKSSGDTPLVQTTQSAPPVIAGPKIRIIVADLLMVDGDFYVVRSEFGEIRIEATPDTKVAEAFDFGDRIKAKVLPNDKAIFIERAKPEDPIGIQAIEPSTQSQPSSAPHTQEAKPKSTAPTSESNTRNIAKGTRVIVAKVLMIDGDFIIVRGERGEIQIEVTPKTEMTEEFQFGDKIKATITSTDKALSVQRAKPEDPIGITEH